MSSKHLKYFINTILLHNCSYVICMYGESRMGVARSSLLSPCSLINSGILLGWRWGMRLSRTVLHLFSFFLQGLSQSVLIGSKRPSPQPLLWTQNSFSMNRTILILPLHLALCCTLFSL